MELDASSILSVQDRWLPFPRTWHKTEVMGWNITTASAVKSLTGEATARAGRPPFPRGALLGLPCIAIAHKVRL